MSACVYASEEELAEDLLYYALSKMARERLAMQERNPAASPLESHEYRHARTRAREHLDKLAARSWRIDPMLVGMARAEGLL